MNATVFYGLHMAEGVAEYQPPEGDPYRLFLKEATLKEMDTTFAGCPVFIDHQPVEKMSSEEIREKAVGWVVESFFNKLDGKHWVKFVVTSDKAEEAIRSGWQLSNAYNIKSASPGGTWHAVEYAKEVMDAAYEHLAIVNSPRYEESIILTPEAFKAYNAKKAADLDRMTNSKGEESVALNFFKKAKVENSIDIANTIVQLPKSKREVSIEAIVNEADEIALASSKPKMANGDDLVKVGEEEMSLNALMEKYNAVCSELSEMKAKNAEPEEKKGDAMGKE